MNKKFLFLMALFYHASIYADWQDSITRKDIDTARISHLLYKKKPSESKEMIDNLSSNIKDRLAQKDIAVDKKDISDFLNTKIKEGFDILEKRRNEMIEAEKAGKPYIPHKEDLAILGSRNSDDNKQELVQDSTSLDKDQSISLETSPEYKKQSLINESNSTDAGLSNRNTIVSLDQEPEQSNPLDDPEIFNQVREILRKIADESAIEIFKKKKNQKNKLQDPIIEKYIYEQEKNLKKEIEKIINQDIDLSSKIFQIFQNEISKRLDFLQEKENDKQGSFWGFWA